MLPKSNEFNLINMNDKLNISNNDKSYTKRIATYE